MAFLALFALSSGFADVTAGAIAAAQRDDPDLLRIRKGDLSIFLPSICAPGPVAAAAYRAASLAAAVAVARTADVISYAGGISPCFCTYFGPCFCSNFSPGLSSCFRPECCHFYSSLSPSFCSGK